MNVESFLSQFEWQMLVTSRDLMRILYPRYIFCLYRRK
ncbi:hypothetical protein CNE_BB1p03140 (plasmid) [Cupriavidus necator N-1]|uniref:Uncharacterized protein n=1 Tax=Cupriavidus necator (strain ATCC 43291 / DSM 13513 / CCUG 52238 / LMG 8453 / N-1) TaxID=1042878 RepID=F8GWL8_CUPNN|nr:hypothetical protein CNE_BB1p03140 [Cupriavidus necator N-1]